MLLSIDITEKSFGDKVLYTDLRFEVEAGEKVGLIGRNGTGKSTLLNMITGEDTDYQGEIITKQGITIIASRQEHHGFEQQSVLEYVQGDLPEFAELSHIIDTYPAEMQHSQRKMQDYSDALERFSSLGYFEIEDQLQQAFAAYQIDSAKLHQPLASLSGGQKRMVELVKVQRARGHLALIDEPTNHMDYVAKAEFIKWLKAADEAVLVITHDRDVLAEVDKIIEIRNGQAYTFRGNYNHYLRVNSSQVTAQVNEFDLVQRRISNLGEDLIRFRRLKERARDPGTIKRFKSQELKVEKELAQLHLVEQPSFWIDRDSAGELNPKMTGAYEKYKARNIRLDTRSAASRSSRLLVEAHGLQLGYHGHSLFDPLHFALREGERLRLHGRNGAGKTTIVRAVMARVADEVAPSELLGGTLSVEKDARLGLYEQEIDGRYLELTLGEAIEQSHMERNVPVSDQKVKQLLGEYLFNPATDGDTMVGRLSGGQKARLQLIRMLIGNPMLLVLDEPTNHLDLPSIEELEDALANFHGAVIYISHDSYFAEKVGGETVAVGLSTGG